MVAVKVGGRYVTFARYRNGVRIGSIPSRVKPKYFVLTRIRALLGGTSIIPAGHDDTGLGTRGQARSYTSTYILLTY